MKKSKFEECITTSFKTETPDILDKIKSSDQFHVPDKVKKYDFGRFFNKRLSYSLASIFVLAIAIFSVLSFGTDVPAVVASTFTLDINPSIEITLDDNDNVINISAINTDSELLIDRDIKFEGISLDRVIEIIITEAIKSGLFSDDIDSNIILIDVYSDRADIKARVEAALEAKITQEMTKVSKSVQVAKVNRKDLSPNQIKDLKDIANQHKISLAKLQLIKRIIEADDSNTIETLKSLSIKRLYKILGELFPNEDTTPGSKNKSGNY